MHSHLFKHPLVYWRHSTANILMKKLSSLAIKNEFYSTEYIWIKVIELKTEPHTKYWHYKIINILMYCC